MHTVFQLGNLKERDHFKNLSIDERIKNYNGRVWTGLMWNVLLLGFVHLLGPSEWQDYQFLAFSMNELLFLPRLKNRSTCRTPQSLKYSVLVMSCAVKVH
jgi:hypothetical protein